MAKHVLIAGASGVVGFSALKHYSSLGDWKITATSRRPPLEAGTARFTPVDLADSKACEAFSGGLSDVTHVVYAALHEEPSLIAGWREASQIATHDAMLRNLFEIRLVTPQPSSSTLVVRAPRNVLDAATRTIEGLGDSRPQVMLDIHVYEITNTLTRNMGLQIPNNFKLFNIPAGALAALAGQNIQDLINQLIASGGINQSSSQALSALLAQLSGQQSSIFSQPLTTFGGGLTLMGLSLGTAGAQLSLNESNVKTLEHATLRIAQGNNATFNVGTKFPIINASFAPVFNTPAIASVIQNNSFQSPFPSFTYEDIGLSIKAKPVVSGNSDVNLDLEFQFRTLTGQSLNGVPVISNREYKGSIVLMDGEPAVVAGAVTHSEQRSLNGIPGLGSVPGLNQVMTSNSKENDEDELLIVLTPRVISHEQIQNAEVWMQK